MEITKLCNINCLGETSVGAFAPPGDAEYDHPALLVEDGVDDPPGSMTDAMKVPLQLDHSRGPWIGTEGVEVGVDSAEGFLGQAIKLSLGGRLKQDLVTHAARRARRRR